MERRRSPVPTRRRLHLLSSPDGEVGLVDFAFLSKHAPEPFKSEWSGGQGINIHNKFVVVDFDQPGAKVYAGSSNFAPSDDEKTAIICCPSSFVAGLARAMRTTPVGQPDEVPPKRRTARD